MDPRRDRAPPSMQSVATAGLLRTQASLGRGCRPALHLPALLPVYLVILLTLLPACQAAADCSPLPSISHGNITYEVHHNSTLQAQITCDLNYRLLGRDVIMCLPTGRWNDSAPSCELVLCESLPTIPNGEVLHSGTRVGSMANYTCIKGFRMMGSAARTCLPNATWTGVQPQCKRIVCKHPGMPLDGTATPADVTDYPAGTTISYSCRLGYNLNGSSDTLCSDQGFWTSPVPQCLITDCGSPPLLPHAYPQYNSTLLWEVVTYVCDVGYSSRFNTSFKCAVNASWTGAISPCTELPPEVTTLSQTTSDDFTTSPAHLTSSSLDDSFTTSPSDTTASSMTTYIIRTSPSESPTSTSAPLLHISSEGSTEGPLSATSTAVSSGSSIRIPSMTTHPLPAVSTPEVTSIKPTTDAVTSEDSDIGTSEEIVTSGEGTTLVTSRTSRTSRAVSINTTPTHRPTTSSTLETSPTPVSSPSPRSSQHMSVEKLGIIIGIVIGSILLLVLIFALCVLCRLKRNRGAYQVRGNSSPKEESAIMIESPKPEVYVNGHVIGNGHDNHVTILCEEPHTMHALGGGPQHAPPNNSGQERNGRQGEDLCMRQVKEDRVPDEAGGSWSSAQTHKGLNGNTCDQNSHRLARLTQKTAL